MNTNEDTERNAVLHIVEMFLPLFSQQRWDEWIDLWADDGMLEFPFAPSGRRNSYVGKTEILAYMMPLAGKMKIEEVSYHNVYSMLDPKIVCMELGIKARIVKTGAPYNQRYISIFEMKDGKVWRYREYWNPMVSMEANGGREAWTNAIGTPEPAGGAS